MKKNVKWAFGKLFGNLLSATITLACLMYLVVTLPQIHSNILWKQSSQRIGIVTNAEHKGHGTGFMVKGNSGIRYIMTNNHVCNFIPTGGVFVNERVNTFVMPFYQDQKADLCLLKYNPSPEVSSDFTLGDEPLLNQEILTMGYPLDHLKHFAGGAVSGDRLVDVAEPYTPECKGTPQEIPTIFGIVQICVIRRFATETSVSIFPGNSGSPVLNKWGHLVGVMFAGSSESNLGTMVRWSDVKRVLEAN